MDDTLIVRLKQWLTPERPLRSLSAPVDACMQASFRLYILKTDGLSRALLDRETREAAFERLRDRLFPNLSFRIDGNDVDEIDAAGSHLLLTPLASARWLQAAARRETQVEFSFLYSPFLIALGGGCRASGWVVPASSVSPFPYPRVNASFGVRRVSLRFWPRRDAPEASDDPCAVLRSARL
jgi:hypothetical protein